MIFCARATRGRGLPSLDARSGRAALAVPLKRDISEVLSGCHSDVRTAIMYIRVFNCGPAGVRSPAGWTLNPLHGGVLLFGSA